MRDRAGFTLIELMIVVAIIAVIASIAVPLLLLGRLNANETAAVSTLRSIASAQAQFHSLARADVDGDGMGEYGTFRELSGDAPVRAGTAGEAGHLRPPVVSTAFRNVSANGEVPRSGYYFKIFLPASSGAGVSPDQTGSYAAVDTDLAETTWCCYAWPATYASSGLRVFLLNQSGDIVASENRAYSGSLATFPAGAGFVGAGGSDSITGQVAVGTTGGDGKLWRVVN